MKLKESLVILKKIKNMDNKRIDGIVLKARGRYNFQKLLESIPNADITDKIIRNYGSADLTYTPLFPFFDLIKEITDKMTEEQIDELIDKSEVYVMHREYFEGYLKNKFLERNEEFFSEETEYVIGEIFKSVIRIMDILYSDKKIIICIDEYEKLGTRSKEFIKILYNAETYFSVVLIMAENIDDKQMHKYSIESLENFAEKNLVVLETVNTVEIEKKQIEISFEENLRNAFYYISFYEFDKAILIFEDIIKQNIIDFSKMKYEDISLFYRMMGDCCFYLKNYDMAILNYNKLLNISIENEKTSDTATAYLKIANVNYERKNMEGTVMMAHLGLKFAQECKNEVLICKGYYCLLGAAGTELHRKNPKLIRKYFNDIINVALKYKMYNTYMVSIGMTASYDEPYENFDNRIEVCKKGIQLAKDLKNKYKLASLYHNLGMAYSGTRKDTEVFYYYKQSEKIKEEIGNKIEICRICNGIGYEYYLREDYAKAAKYVAKALEYVFDIRDYREIGMTFYNMAMICIMSENYEEAIYYMELIVSIITVLDFHDLHYHSLPGVYAAISFACFKINDVNKGIEYCNKAGEVESLLKYDEIVFFGLASSRVLELEGKIDKAFESYMKAYSRLNVRELEIFVPFFCYEYGTFLKRINKTEEARKIFENGIGVAEEIGYGYRKALMMKELGENVEIKKMKIPRTKNFDLDILLNYAEQKKIFNRMQRRMSEINFLNSVQKILVQTHKSIKEMALEYSNCIKNFFYVEKIFIFYKEEKIGTIFCDEIEKDTPESVFYEKIRKCIDEKGVIDKELIKEETDTGCVSIIPIMNGEETAGYTVLYNKKENVSFSEEDIFTFGIGVKQLTVALFNKKLQAELEEQNLVLKERNNRLKSIEKMISIVYNDKEKDIEKMIELMMAALFPALDYKFNGILYFGNEKQEWIFKYRVYIEDTYEYSSVDKEKEKYTRLVQEIEEIREKGLQVINKKIECDGLCKENNENGNYIVKKSGEGIFDKFDFVKTEKVFLFPVVYEEEEYGYMGVEVSGEEMSPADIDTVSMFGYNLALYLDRKRIELEQLSKSKEIEFRCSTCNKKLMEYKGDIDFIEIKCPRCNSMNFKKEEK